MADEPPAEEEDLPLNNEWTVWTNMRSQAGQSKEGWESSLVQLGNFTTINKFWEYCRFIHNHFEDLRSAERNDRTIDKATEQASRGVEHQAARKIVAQEMRCKQLNLQSSTPECRRPGKGIPQRENRAAHNGKIGPKIGP